MAAIKQTPSFVNSFQTIIGNSPSSTHQSGVVYYNNRPESFLSLKYFAGQNEYTEDYMQYIKFTPTQEERFKIAFSKDPFKFFGRVSPTKAAEYTAEFEGKKRVEEDVWGYGLEDVLSERAELKLRKLLYPEQSEIKVELSPKQQKPNINQKSSNATSQEMSSSSQTPNSKASLTTASHNQTSREHTPSKNDEDSAEMKESPLQKRPLLQKPQSKAPLKQTSVSSALRVKKVILEATASKLMSSSKKEGRPNPTGTLPAGGPKLAQLPSAGGSTSSPGQRTLTKLKKADTQSPALSVGNPPLTARTVTEESLFSSFAQVFEVQQEFVRGLFMRHSGDRERVLMELAGLEVCRRLGDPSAK